MKKFLKYCTMIIIILLFCNIPIIAQAKDKTIEVPIEKDYKSAKFTLTFDYYDNYTAVIVSPDEEEYEATKTADNIMECVVNDVKSGSWSIKISTFVDEEYEVTENTDESDEEISPVKIKIEGSSEALVDVSSDISIATDIAGLKMYFKDDAFVAEWSDTTCGNVNIEVINSKNLQKLDSQTVKGNYYELPIKNDIEEIRVTIVPAVSANIEGAENSYTYKVDNYPDAVISFEDLTITNHDSLKVSADLKKKYAVAIYVNDKKIQQSEMLDKGTYEFDAPIDIGTSRVVAYIIDKDGNMRSTSCTIEKDVVAPILKLESSYLDIKTQDEFITIKGEVEDYDTLSINNVTVEVEGDNTFSYDYKLKEGINEIAVIASDAAGNEAEYDISVEKYIPEENAVPWLKIIICVCLALLAGIYIFEMIKKKKHPVEHTKKQEYVSYDDSEEEIDYENIDISYMSQKDKKTVFNDKSLICETLSFAIPLAVLYIVLQFILLVSVVQSGSMEPSLNVGNTVFYNRLAYQKTEPQRGDVIVFYSDEFSAYFGKRIIGLPGDEISFKDGYVVINGQYCDESAYINSEIETNCRKDFTVPDGCYFMLGDNREKSNDSRFWKEPYISKDKIKGKYMGQIDFSFQFDILNKILGRTEE